MARKLISVFELCVRRAAAVEPKRMRAALLAGHVSAFVDEWARMMRETGNEGPTLAEWREWANASERTAYRRQAEFRRLFEQWHEDPTPLARHVNRALAARGHDAVPDTFVRV